MQIHIQPLLMASKSLIIVSILALFEQVYSSKDVDLTKGFASVPLNSSNFEIQRPYDVEQNQRYSFKNGVHRLWVFSTDKPHLLDSKTKPRTELRIQGYDYSFGIWQFEAYGYVPQETSGVCIMQVFGASGDGHASTLMLRVYTGSLFYYRSVILIPKVYNKWFKLNVIHDVDNSKVMVYINGKLKLKAPGRGGISHYFKLGVYAQDDDSHYMESRWKDIRVYKRN